MVSVLSGMLRVGIALDRTHSCAVRDISCDVHSDDVTVTAHVAPGANAALELYTAEQRKDLLEIALGRHLVITADG